MSLSSANEKKPTAIEDVNAIPLPAYLPESLFQMHGTNPKEIWGAMRTEDTVMRPARLRAVKATRLSFARSLLRRMIDKQWRISQRHKDIDMHGDGFLIYDIVAEGYEMSFVVASCSPESSEDRLGRFYETVYDFYGSLMEGHVDLGQAKREADTMKSGVWSGRTGNNCIGWTVANRSNRFFDHVVERLVAGSQPDAELLASGGGYIVRNAGWYGNGRHGSRSWLSLPGDHPLAQPYHVDLFALYLWRTVSYDVAEATAAAKSGTTDLTRLEPDVRRHLGIGNSSGIGMVAALVRWPAWLGTYNLVREMSLAYAITRPAAEREKYERLEHLLGRAERYFAAQPPSQVIEVEAPAVLAKGLHALGKKVAAMRREGCLAHHPWAVLTAFARAQESMELEEQLNSLLIEIEPEFADAAGQVLPLGMNIPRRIDPRMAVGTLIDLLQRRYGWALNIDLDAPGARAYFWYKSEENGEQRRGERQIDPGVENETFLDVAGVVQQLYKRLIETDPTISIGEFLLTATEFCNAVGRAQLADMLPYTEIRCNILDHDFLPMDGIRFLLSTMGLEASAPYSTRWVRGVFLQGAPLPEEVAMGANPDWIFPNLQHQINQ